MSYTSFQIYEPKNLFDEPTNSSDSSTSTNFSDSSKGNKINQTQRQRKGSKGEDFYEEYREFLGYSRLESSTAKKYSFNKQLILEHKQLHVQFLKSFSELNQNNGMKLNPQNYQILHQKYNNVVILQKPYIYKCSLHRDINHSKSKSIEHEFNIIKQLSHPSIIELTQRNMFENLKFQNKFMCGYQTEAGDMDLFEYLKQNHPKYMDLPIAIFLLKQVAQGLQYMHGQKKIAHNDIKLENIILFFDQYNIPQKAKIIDFGFSREDQDLTKQSVAGNFLHILQNPQQVQFPNEQKSDIFQLGLTIFNVIFLDSPFNNDDVNVLDASYKYLVNGDYELFWNSKRNMQIARKNLGKYDQVLIEYLLDILKNMLNPCPDQRLDINQVINHPLFNKQI